MTHISLEFFHQVVDEGIVKVLSSKKRITISWFYLWGKWRGEESEKGEGGGKWMGGWWEYV